MAYVAFVLHIEKPTERVILLDQCLGKRELKISCTGFFPYKHHLMVKGALISYETNQIKKTIDHVNMIAAPLIMARQELLFLHQILSVCYYCIPIGCPMPILFKIIYKLIESQEVAYSSKIKKLLVLLIFFQCGMLGQELIQQETMINYLLSETLEDILKANYTIMESELDRLLYACIQFHPHQEKLKIVLRGK